MKETSESIFHCCDGDILHFPFGDIPGFPFSDIPCFSSTSRSCGAMSVYILIQTGCGLFPHLRFQACKNIFSKLEWSFLRPLEVLGSQ